MIEWDDAWNMGVDTIDSQHKQLVDLINVMTAGKYDTMEVLKQLIDYTAFHFMDEEEFMSRSNYPDEEYIAHKKEHHDLKTQLLEYSFKLYVPDYIDEKRQTEQKLLKLIETWYINHFLGTDKKFSKWLKEENSNL
jgi:hemerythrin-like metal-binding protein